MIWQARQAYAKNNLKESIRLLKKASRVDPGYPRVWLELCQDYQLTEEFDLAVEACKRAVQLEPNDALSYNSLGLAYGAAKNYPEAAKAFERATLGDSRSFVLSNWFDALWRSKQFEKALSVAERRVEVSATGNSVDESALYALGGVYTRLGKPEKAAGILARLRERHPEWNSMSCTMGVDDDAKSSISCNSPKVADSTKAKSKLDPDFEEGLKYWGQDKYPEAANAFEKAAGNSPVWYVYNQWVWALVASEQYEKAVVPCQKLVDLSAGRAVLGQDHALGILGAIYTRLGQSEKAQQAFDRAHELNPTLGTCIFGWNDQRRLQLQCHN
ncbi:MAG: tetratricopeptide repeat protein [Acidobacteriota bacterium]|nr:tetratricopeptide repeat protein [Acidobacteriota bacterium]